MCEDAGLTPYPGASQSSRVGSMRLLLTVRPGREPWRRWAIGAPATAAGWRRGQGQGKPQSEQLGTLGHPRLPWLGRGQALLCGPVERWVMSIATSSEVSSPLSVPSQPGNRTSRGPHTSALLPSKLSLFVEACLPLEPGALCSPVY